MRSPAAWAEISGWRLALLFLGLCACKGKPVAGGVAAVAPPATPVPPAPLAATRALLVLGADGSAEIRCPDGDARKRRFSTEASAIAEVGRGDGVPYAAVLTHPFSPPGALVLLGPGEATRKVAENATGGRFSPDGRKLLYETCRRSHVAGGVIGWKCDIHVLALGGGSVVHLADASAAVWEPSSTHVRASRYSHITRERRGHVRLDWTSARLRWEPGAGTSELVGPGDHQLPAPVGDGLAYRLAAEVPGMFATDSSSCTLTLEAAGRRSEHVVVGPWCMGPADERSVRWSPDGRWLAFTAGEGARAGHLRVVSTRGEPHPRMTAMQPSVDAGSPDAASPATRGLSWLDWAPGGAALVAQDATGLMQLHDLERGIVSGLGPGYSPTWSPDGRRLLVFAERPGQPEKTVEAYVLDPRGTRLQSLGSVRDARWLDADLCGP